MKKPRRIVICGISIFAAAIESGLQATGIGQVLAFDHHLPHALARIRAMNPSLVIMEKTGCHEIFARALLDQYIPVIILDESERKITAMSGQCISDDLYLEAGITELTQTMEKILSTNRTTFNEHNQRMGEVDMPPPEAQ